MKINIDIDCTPEEARTFLGLPDVRPMQEAVMQEAEDRLKAAMRSMDPETIMKLWMPGGLEGWEKLQQAFWKNFGGSGRGEE
jgi:hypothetical protein